MTRNPLPRQVPIYSRYFNNQLPVGHGCTREGHASIFIRDLPKDNIVLTHYMLSKFWLHLLDIIGHYVIQLGAIEHILMMANNFMTLCYTYSNTRLKNPPDVFFQIVHISRLISWIPSRLSCNPALWGRDQSLLRTRPPKSFTWTNNQEGPNFFHTSMRYILWDLGCTHSINPYFDLYTDLNPL